MKKMTLLYSAVLTGLLGCGLAQAADSGDQLVARGEYLATAGDCVACHTASGPAFTGGLKMTTPVGAIYSTNITPDKQTGIGEYTYDDFARALRQGVARDGRHLYPAMPYTDYAKISDDDMHALYAYFMQGVTAVHHQNKPSDIPWPLNMRWPLAIWNKFFLNDKPFAADPTQSAEWNRGAYLVQGLEHCSACHTPRGIAFQEKATDEKGADFLTGGTLEGWHAPDLTGNVKSGLGRWSVDDLQTFLKTGRTDESAAFGSMSEAIEHSTQHLTDADLHAMAVYIKSLKSSDPQAKPPATTDSTTAALIHGDLSQTGAADYINSCSACHRLDGKGYAKTFPALAGNPVLLSDDPSSLISIVLQGGKMPVTTQSFTGLTMPDFGWRLSDQQVADVVTFIRSSWGNNAGKVEAKQVAAIRKLMPAHNQSDNPQVEAEKPQPVKH